MTTLTEERVMDLLRRVRYPGFSRNIVSFGLVKAVRIEGETAKVHLSVATRDPGIPDAIRHSIEMAWAEEKLPGRAALQIDVHEGVPGGQGVHQTTDIPGVKRVLAVASGKGGVGKSTVAANLALALGRLGRSVGLCDCDIYGPSIGLMFGARERPMVTEDNRIEPVEREGLRLMSMGLLLDDASPAVLRGPMVTRYTQQFLRQVAWGDLDYLVLDLPPGTGDIQLTIVQTVALAGAVLVTTPQEVALIDVRKAASMFEKVNVPVLGIVENMSYFQCPGDGRRYDIFGEGGGRREAARLGVPLLGEIPLDIATREAGDRGCPVVAADPENPVARAFLAAAAEIDRTLAAKQP